MPRIVFCTPEGEAKAQQVIEKLKDAGFSNKDISIILPDPTGNMFLAYEFNHKSQEGTTAGATTGAVAGVLGSLFAFGAIKLGRRKQLVARNAILVPQTLAPCVARRATSTDRLTRRRRLTSTAPTTEEPRHRARHRIYCHRALLRSHRALAEFRWR